MWEYIIIELFALLFLIIGIAMLRGKGSFLIAGYNTAPEEERAKYDEKKLCKSTGTVCIICAIMVAIMGVLGYLVDSNQINESVMGVYGIIFSVVIIVAVICSSIYTNTKCKKKN